MTQAALRNYIAARASTSSTSEQPLGTKLDKDIELGDTLGFIVTGNMNAGQTVNQTLNHGYVKYNICNKYNFVCGFPYVLQH